MTCQRMSWTQPICEVDWIEQNAVWATRISPETGDSFEVLESVRMPVVITGEGRGIERCAYCGSPTILGAYKRDDPANVRYPRPRDDP